MSRITAKGKYMGSNCIVECFLEDGSLIIELNGEFNQEAQTDFETKLKTSPAIAGTYYPPKNSMLAGYSVLESIFFDVGSPPEIEVEGDIGEIPTYDIDDIVY